MDGTADIVTTANAKLAPKAAPNLRQMLRDPCAKCCAKAAPKVAPNAARTLRQMLRQTCAKSCFCGSLVHNCQNICCAKSCRGHDADQTSGTCACQDHHLVPLMGPPFFNTVSPFGASTRAETSAVLNNIRKRKHYLTKGPARLSPRIAIGKHTPISKMHTNKIKFGPKKECADVLLVARSSALLNK